MIPILGLIAFLGVFSFIASMIKNSDTWFGIFVISFFLFVGGVFYTGISERVRSCVDDTSLVCTIWK